jgi:transposase InsO family protein
MHKAMKTLGFQENEKIIRNRMKKLGLKCEIRQKKYVYAKTEKQEEKCTNYLKQKFNPTKPNRYFSVDITCIPTKNGMVYLNVILDLYGKLPIAHLTSYSCNSKLAEDTLDILVNKRKSVNNAILHSDRGVTYLSKNYIQKMNSLRLIRSNSKKGYPYDNACSENFFSILKTEKLYRLGYIPQNKEEVDELVDEYINFYINERISSSLGGLTPKQYYDNYINNKKRLANIA